MAQTPASSATKPQTSMLTEVFYSKTETGTLNQIFYVQEIPPLVTAREPVTFGSLECTDEMTAKGRRKAESITMPVLFYEEQSDALYELSQSDEPVWFFIKLPDETASVEGKPLVFKFQAALDLSNDTISIDSMLQETVTLFKQSPVTRMKGLPGSIL